MPDCRYGTFTYPDDAYIGRSLETYGEYSEQEVAFLISLLQPESVVVEVGANIGAITVPLAKAAGAVLAYEPQTDIFEMLRSNVAASPSVTIVNLGLGKTAHTAHYTSNVDNTGGVGLGHTGDHEIRVVTLDDDFSLDRLDLLKIDVEGMETDVLLGARRTIAKYRPLLYVENDRTGNAHRLLDTLFAFGYRVWRHEPPLFNPENHLGVRDNIFPNVVSFNLIAVSDDQDVPLQIAGLSEIKYELPYRLNIAKERWACIARMGGLGDNLMASSVLPGLKARWGKVEVISKAPCHEVFLNNPFVDKLTVWPKDEEIADMKVWSQAMRRRLGEYDFAVHLSHSCEGKLVFFDTQTEFDWPDKMRRKMAERSYLGYIHDICDLPHDFAPNFFPMEHEVATARNVAARIRSVRDAPIVGWCLSGSRIDKAYPGAPAAIARLLELGLNVMMFGAPGKEFLMAKEIERQLIQQTGPDERGSSAGLYLAMSDNIEKPDWPMRRSFSQLQMCDAVVAPDTGPSWAVAMREMPKVILLSHASPLNITHKWVNTTTLHADQSRVSCHPCHQLHNSFLTCRKAKDVEAAACISDIPVNAIVTAVRAGLSL